MGQLALLRADDPADLFTGQAGGLRDIFLPMSLLMRLVDGVIAGGPGVFDGVSEFGEFGEGHDPSMPHSVCLIVLALLSESTMGMPHWCGMMESSSQSNTKPEGRTK